jgi:hypothetical protein
MTNMPPDPQEAAMDNDAGKKSAPKRTRRTFLGTAGGLALGSAIASKLSGPARVRAQGYAPDGRSRNDRWNDEQQRKRALKLRLEAAWNDHQAPVAQHPTNGDEERYPNKIGTDTRGLPHDARGEVEPAAWALAAKAFATRDPADFEKIPLGGTRKLVNPVGTLAANLSGVDPTQVSIPPAPELASAQRASEAVELYWQALLRDVPFHEYATHPDVATAVAELDKLPGFAGPRVNGKVTPDTLFRGSVTYTDPLDASGRTPKHVIPPGVLDGPYLSQFLLRDIPYGVASVSARYRLPTASRENDFATTHEEWLAVQNGVAPKRSTKFETSNRYAVTGRDLAEYVHGGSPSFAGAAILLGTAASKDPTAVGGLGAPLSPTNPYLQSRSQVGANASFASGYFQSIVGWAQSLAIRVEYWQKWFVHRTLRAEAFGGLVNQVLAEGADYPLHDDLLRSEALARSQHKHGSFLLPQAYPEGAPLHSAYPGGNASISGVSVTLLKAFFDESWVIPNPVQADPRDPSKLVPYEGPPLTVGGELNKLALNSGLGRNWAGIHWRSDAASAFAAGEAIAIGILRNEKLTLRESFPGFSLTKFDGSKITI